MKLALRTAFACIVFGMSSHFAKAAIIIDLDQSGSGSLGTVNLPGGVTGVMTIDGTANGGALFRFTGNEPLQSPSSGQARIEAVDGGFLFLDMRFTLGQLFERIVFNLNSTAGTVNVQAINAADVVGATQNIVLGNGENFINVQASGGDQIKAIILSSGVEIDDIRQVRVNALLDTGIGSNAVPEPSTWAMVGFGLLGVGLLGRLKAR